MKMHWFVAGVASLALGFVGCESDSGGTSNGGTDVAGGGSDTGGGGGADTGGGGGADTGGGAPGIEVLATDEASLHDFLKTDGYGAWAAESAVHDSPIHGKVLVFANPTLDASLKAGNASHPMGSASVKELYDADGATLKGWAVMIKTQADSDGGNGWYWYETTDLTSAANPTISGKGDATCTGCHGGGTDYFKSAYPLK